MRLVFISDTHNQFSDVELPDGDILIHCGDALSYGNEREMQQFCDDSARLHGRYRLILYTPGNHDRCVELNPNYWERRLRTYDVTMLLHRTFEFEGTVFFGSPYTPEFYDWSFMYPRGEGEHYWRQIPDETDVVFTHGMPFGILDETGRLLDNGDDDRAGCPALRRRLDELKPKVFAGGHLHLQGGQQVNIDGTTFINAAICDDGYRPTRSPMVVDI